MKEIKVIVWLFLSSCFLLNILGKNKVELLNSRSNEVFFFCIIIDMLVNVIR